MRLSVRQWAGSARVRWALLPALTLFAACGDDATGPTAQLDAEGAAAIAEFVAGIGLTGPASPTMGRAADNWTLVGVDFDVTVQCPLGGHSAVSGTQDATFDEATGLMTAAWSSEQTYAGCAFDHEARGYTLNGGIETDGSIQLSLSATGEPELLALSGSQSGRLDVVAGGETFSCVIDLVHGFDAVAGSFAIEGSVCGHQVSVHVSLDEASG